MDIKPFRKRNRGEGRDGETFSKSRFEKELIWSEWAFKHQKRRTNQKAEIYQTPFTFDFFILLTTNVNRIATNNPPIAIFIYEEWTIERRSIVSVWMTIIKNRIILHTMPASGRGNKALNPEYLGTPNAPCVYTSTCPRKIGWEMGTVVHKHIKEILYSRFY